jgi:hypothetical protein
LSERQCTNKLYRDNWMIKRTKHTQTHTLFQCAELMVGARRKNINYTYSANFKENGVKKLQSSASSRHIITHSFSIAVNIMVFSNLHTHNNQRDTIRAFPLSINKSRREFVSVRVVLLGNKKNICSYHLITTFTSINFPRHRAA